MGAAHRFDSRRPKGGVAGTKNVCPTDNGGLKNRVVIRVAYDGLKFRRQTDHQRGLFEQAEISMDGFVR